MSLPPYFEPPQFYSYSLAKTETTTCAESPQTKWRLHCFVSCRQPYARIASAFLRGCLGLKVINQSRRSNPTTTASSLATRALSSLQSVVVCPTPSPLQDSPTQSPSKATRSGLQKVLSFLYAATTGGPLEVTSVDGWGVANFI